MQLSHMSDRPLDLKTQMRDLTRNTTRIDHLPRRGFEPRR